MAQNKKTITDGKSSEDTKKEEVKKDMAEEAKVSEELFRIPKNIRQIGKEECKRKLYIEDYVLNLMKQLSKRSSMDYQMAVLLGQAVHSDGILYLFVKGAVEVHKLTLDASDNFTGDTWSGIYSQIKQHFHDVDIVGWFLTKPGLKESPDLKLTRIHERNFQDKKSDEEKGNGENRCLLLYDSIENRENFFIYDHNRFKKAHGYYIYYERNHDMQEYLISHSSNLSIENGFEDVAVKKIRQAMIKERSSIEKEEKVEGKQYREPAVIKKNNSRTDSKNTNIKNGAMGGSVKLKAALTALFIMFFCIIAAKSNLGERQDVWNSSDGKGKNGSLNNEGAGKDSTEVNGWVLNEEVGNDEGDDEGQEQASVSVGLPEITIISDGEEIGNDSMAGDVAETENTGSDEESGDDEGNEGDENALEENAGESGEDEGGTDSGENEDASEENEDGSGEDESDSEGNSGENKENEENNAGTDNGESAVNGGAQESSARYYTVKEGDTLASISLKEYHTILRAEEIQKLNDIEDPDLIYTGQTLIIP